MNTRLLVALILSPIATAASYAAGLHWQFMDMNPKPTNVSFLLPGIAAGAVFEIVALLPLLLILRRLKVNGTGVFIAGGLLLWVAASFSMYASFMPLREAAQTTVSTMFPGFVMVLVFGLVAVRRADA